MSLNSNPITPTNPNRAEQGSLREGDELPDVPLFPLRPPPSPADSPAGLESRCGATSLRAACAGTQPILLVAGSFT